MNTRAHLTPSRRSTSCNRRDAQTTAICQHLLFVEHEERELVERDEFAPETESPNYERYRALLEERAALCHALSQARPPKTSRGVQMLAEVAMTFIDVQRAPATNLFTPQDFVEWVTLHALTCAAGRHEKIPLPNYSLEQNLH